jgi:predicted amidophosphoribosyltransferase
LRERALKRIKLTTPQVGLTAAKRVMNLSGAFEADPDACAGRDLLLIDDVCTTGATLQAAARALRHAGARNVHAAVLAIAVSGQAS